MPKKAKYVFLVRMPDDVLELTEKFMINPEKILVNKKNLTLSDIFILMLK